MLIYVNNTLHLIHMCKQLLTNRMYFCKISLEVNVQRVIFFWSTIPDVKAMLRQRKPFKHTLKALVEICQKV